MDKGTMYLGGIMIGAIIMMSIVNGYLQAALPPQLAQQVSGAIMLVIMIGSIVGLEASYILRTSAYTHIQMLIRPYNELLELFVDDGRIISGKVGENLWSTEFPLAFPRRIKNYGNAKISKIRLLHEYERTQRLDFKPGRASLDEYTFNHPQTEFIEVVQLPEQSTSIDRAEVIPEFKLLAARNDYRRSFADPNQARGAVAEPPGDVENYVTKTEHERIKELLAAKTAEAKYFHTQSISTEQWVEQQRIETRGLLGAMNSITAYAIEFLLQLIKAFGSVDKALAHLRGSAFDRWGKWLIIGVLGGATIVYVQLNPGTLNGFYQYMSDPSHQIIIIAFAAVAFVAAYLVLRRRKA